MAIRKVLVEMTQPPSAALETLGPTTGIGTLAFDPSFEVVPLPAGTSAVESLGVDQPPETYLMRAEIDDNNMEAALAAEQDPNNPIVGIFSDPEIAEFITCANTAPVGSDTNVEQLLCVPALHEKGMRGAGVLVAIVDTGVNIAYLASRGKPARFDKARSWVPQAGLTPGSLPVGHGTMCAFDVSIAAPDCTLLDVAVLSSTATGGSAMAGLLSDAVRAYAHLRTVLTRNRPKGMRALVVNNSWGMFHASWDFPVGHPGNYSDNPGHPFNRIVATLEQAGADILFAAGNCGAPCPDGRCQSVTNAGVFGANSHAQVLCVAGVDTTGVRVGYSTSGPGRLQKLKPDICGYTHFRGSGVYAADGGTSAATPVVAGLVAAVRSRFPQNPSNPSTSPAAMRTLLIRTATDLGPVGFDYDHGWGVVNGCKLAALSALEAVESGTAIGTPVPVPVGGGTEAVRPIAPSPVRS